MKWALLAMLAGSAFAQTSGVTLRIETAGGRTQFKMGEAIGLKLTFDNPSGANWQVFGIQRGGRSVFGLWNDRFTVSPKEGTTDPRFFELREGHGSSGPGGIVLGSKLVSTNVNLNEWVRFDRAGRYRLNALFHAILPNANVRQQLDADWKSNEIEIEIVPADQEWLAEQLRQAVAVLDAPTDPQGYNARVSAVRAIWYLDTPESVRAAARLLGTLDEQTARPLMAALRGSAHQDTAIAAMKQLLRLPDQAVTLAFIQMLASMEAAQKFPLPGDRDADDPDVRKRSEASAALRQQLSSELAGAVERKRGAAKAVSLATVIGAMRVESITESQRAELAAGFMDLPWRQQNDLLGVQWKRIAGPAMIPVLRQFYEGAPDAQFQSPAAMAVQRLYELDPARTRTLILDDMKREPPQLPFATLAILPDATLPEMDNVLLDHLQHGTGSVELIARYATAKILDGVKAWDAKRDAEMRAQGASQWIPSRSCQPALIGYYLRVDPAWGERALRDVLNDRGEYSGQCWMGIVGRTAEYQAGPDWEKVAIGALADQAVFVKADAAKALGQHGSALAQQAVMEAFRYWHDWWKDRTAELNDENRRFEQELFQAAARGKAWIADNDELEKIRGLCITSNCSGEAEQYRREWTPQVQVSIGESGGGDVNVSLAQYYMPSLDAARVRLLQVPAGTRLRWNFNVKHTPAIDAWVAAMDSDLAGRGVLITR